jgi:hypothetical protein
MNPTNMRIWRDEDGFLLMRSAIKELINSRKEELISPYLCELMVETFCFKDCLEITKKYCGTVDDIHLPSKIKRHTPARTRKTGKILKSSKKSCRPLSA